ncbi:Exocyst complex component 1 [Smittium mucronatum]|uniref:Exocyst complex component 1 n=1 Tax=Smittium mucronatum TaxID=133383 RepID=A0A1R0H3T4_9FUNG|nr:Exocyst complex component 1 [Smittium mucronatum]
MSLDVERTKTLAAQIRRNLFVGVEDDPQTSAALKAAGPGAKKERLLNLVEVREGESSEGKGELKSWILCLTGKRLSASFKASESAGISSNTEKPKKLEKKKDESKSKSKSKTSTEPVPPSSNAKKSIEKVDSKPQLLVSPTDVQKKTSDFNSTSEKKYTSEEKPEITLNESKSELEFENNNLDLDALEDYADLQQTSEDLLLDQTFMLSADELYGNFGWKANVDAAELESQLLSELSKLESENVRDVLEAEKKVPSIIVELEKAINELDVYDIILKKYRDELDSMGDDVHQIQIENENLKIEEINQQKLLIELESFLRKISISDDQVQVLTNETLETVDGIDRIQRVASNIQKNLSLSLEGGLEDMIAFQKNQKKFEYYCSNFSARVYDYLKVMFQFKSEEAISRKPKSSNRGIIELTSSARVHESLVMYCGLTLWLREMKPSADKDLQALYIQNMNRIYNKEGNDLLDSCRSYFFRIRHKDLNYLFTAPASNSGNSSNISYTGRRSSVENDSSTYRPSNVSSNLPGSELGLDLQPYQAFKQGLETIMDNVVAEKNFMADLFHYSPSKRVLSYDSNGDKRREGHKEILAFPTFDQWVNEKWEPIGKWESPRSNYSKESASKEVYSMLDLLFGNLKAHTDSMIDMGTRFDPSQSLGMLSAVEEKLQQCRGSDLEFAQKLLNSAKSKLSGIFTQFSNNQVTFIDDVKITTKKRIGIHPIVKIFPRFLVHLEILAENNHGSARILADKINIKIGQQILDLFNNLVKDAKTLAVGSEIEEQKDYVNALVIALSNVSTLRDGLKSSSIELSSKLNPIKSSENVDSSNKSSNSNLSSNGLILVKQFLSTSTQLSSKLQSDYINVIIRRPTAKLLDFFSGLTEMSSGSKSKSAPEQLPSTYNRAATKRMLSNYNSKEVKELIKLLYKRVDKHFGASSMPINNILKSVWFDIREELLKMFLNFNQILNNVYSDSGVCFDFKQSDLLAWINEMQRV